MYNLFTPVEKARLNNTFTNGLSRFTQNNCQVTLENGLYHIYRPANLTTASNGYTMWGGIFIYNEGITGSQILIKGHSYIIKFHVKGKSSSTPEKMRWSYHADWEGDNSLLPTPTNVSYQTIPANFNGEMECFYKWTLSDDIYKVAETGYGSKVAGGTYLSYNMFAMNFGYSSTGELGTDLYLSNFRMYDLTNLTEKVNVKKTGELNATIIQDPDYSKLSMYKDSEILCKDLYEV